MLAAAALAACAAGSAGVPEPGAGGAAPVFQPPRRPPQWPPRDAAPPPPTNGSCRVLVQEHDTRFPGKVTDATHFLNRVHLGAAGWRAAAANCKAWGLKGEWRNRDRKVYWGVLFAGEFEALTIALEELWPVVDVFILVEARWTLQGVRKPLFWPAVRDAEFKRWAPKVRFVEYQFSDAGDECDPLKHPPGALRNSGKCKWIHQRFSRQVIVSAMRDMRPQDLLLHSDLDELPAREAVAALRNCPLPPEPPAGSGENCTIVRLRGLGHKFDFGCGKIRAGAQVAGGVLGRCLPLSKGPSWLRGAGDTGGALEWKYFAKKWGMSPSAKPRGRIVGDTTVNAAGWHLHAFHDGDVGVLWKIFTRSGTSQALWTERDLGAVSAARQRCLMSDLPIDGGPSSMESSKSSYFRFNAELGCWPVPHALRENPRSWRHLLRWTPDKRWPDPFGTMEWKRRDVEQFRAPP
eukprot:TRINITY_DN6537_c0_g2_i1.p1 TRINITY_DN6537_c0_g2~~TRINITY_DN6537_c0_g2_i1.p1  ORF type:complete len:493 (+),score=135.93 TRINITY_DN6537_c0_g2_i1:94-1479(+)